MRRIEPRAHRQSHSKTGWMSSFDQINDHLQHGVINLSNRHGINVTNNLHPEFTNRFQTLLQMTKNHSNFCRNGIIDTLRGGGLKYV